MKPTFETIYSRRDDGRGARPVRLPVTDCNYHSVSLDGFNGRCIKTSPSFRNISRGYFKNEARHNFFGEAAFFAMMIITVAVPMVSGMYAVADLCRTLGPL